MPQATKGLSLRVRLPYQSEAELLAGYGRHLSRNDIFVATDNVRPTGTVVSLEVLLQAGEPVLRGDAVVAKQPPQPRPGMLLRFLTLDPGSRALLERAFATPEEQAERLVLGVDLGTTAARVALSREGRPAMVAIAAGENRSRAEALRDALAAARKKLALPVSRAVIVVPAYFHEGQRSILREAAAEAGLRVEQLVSAPMALALGHAAGRALPRRRLCVIDFGAHKLDVAIVQVEGDEVEVVACGGDAAFGATVGADPIDHLERVVRSVLVGAGLTPGAIDTLVLGGGRAQPHDLQRRLAEGFGRASIDTPDPETAAAFGAALLGESLAVPDGLQVSDLVPAEPPTPPLASTPADGEVRPL